jgi:hypothetical protein
LGRDRHRSLGGNLGEYTVFCGEPADGSSDAVDL